MWAAVKPSLENVIVTTALKTVVRLSNAGSWYIATRTTSQLNDRYMGKRDQFHRWLSRIASG